MASGTQEVAVGRIVACFVAGSTAAPQAIARLALERRAELLGLFIEDVELLRFAALPFAAEVGIASGARRALDLAGVERALREQAKELRSALAAALGKSAWSFRVARGVPAQAVAAALAEGYAPSLLLPPGAHPGAAHDTMDAGGLTEAGLRALLAVRRPILILPRHPA